MLQIIIFQLSALLWATTNLSKSSSTKTWGVVLAVLFVILGLAQGTSFPKY